MDEDLNEHDLEERLYAMLHHVDGTQVNVSENNQNVIQYLESAAKSTVRRYWRTSVDTDLKTLPKVPSPAIKNPVVNNKPKEEKSSSPVKPPTVDLSIFQSPPQNLKSTIEIIEHEHENQVILESSDDEDEVIEVALPPKPTITIESSDEDELRIVNSPAKSQVRPTPGDRGVSASPVPSVVSSVSDEFIRGDCIALNISSRHADDHSFDFSLHGSDLLDQSTPLKKKKKKKSKEAVTATPVIQAQKSFADECFATPKSKAKNKKKKTFTVSDKSVPCADVYDSDSNQSIIDSNKNSLPYVVTEKSLPSMDVYESDSNQSEIIKDIPSKPSNEIDSSDSSVSLDKPYDGTGKSCTKNNVNVSQLNETTETISIVDLTKNDHIVTLDSTGICESIVMGNVTGFIESEDYEGETLPQNDISKFVSTKIPSILNEDLDFDNLKGKDSVCKRRKYSLTTLRAEMEKFYNESWGGENFNHREIQKNMSRDKSLWAIDPKDRMPSLAKRKTTCNYCNRTGHRDDTCRMKPPICYMCGVSGHFEPRCPSKICVNCGSPNHIYSTMCRNCCTWDTIRCAECGQYGHPSSHCPDLWRRYHNTIDNNVPLERNTLSKKHFQLFCSGCTRRGHLIHACRSTIPFSGLPINSPYVCLYRPIYSPSHSNQDTQSNIQKNNKQLVNKSILLDSGVPSPITPSRPDRNKRQSKSPTVHECHVSKKRTISEDVDVRRHTKSPVNNGHQRKTSQSNDDNGKSKKDPTKNANVDSSKTQVASSDKAPNFISISTTNYDKKGHIIQDNEVSDTSDVITSSRIYVTNEIIDQLKTKEGEEWLKETMGKHNVSIQCTEINSFLSITGKVADQEAFQSELRDWTNTKQNDESSKTNSEVNVSKETGNNFTMIPKNRTTVLRRLDKAFNSLKEEIGDPQAVYKELKYLQNRREQLLKRKVISPKRVSNNKSHINKMLKKLNMILLGQAGLGGGSQHLTELYSFQEKLLRLRQKTIPSDVRIEMGQHYSSIFAAIPRNDYLELLKKFYNSTSIFKNKKSFKQKPQINKIDKKMHANSIPVHEIHDNQNFEQDNDINIFGENVANKNGSPWRQKLVFYHQRLLKARPNDANLKKARMDLVRKLHSFISSLFRNEKLSSKTKKKMKKAQEQAQTFLTNV